MSDTPPSPRKKRVPLRWITLGEAVAVSAVIISGLGLWINYSERQSSTEQTAAAPRAQSPLVLKARVESAGKTLSLEPLRDGQVIQGQTISFPKGLGIDPIETTGDARIEAAWFDDDLMQARDKIDRPNSTAGDEKIAVTIDTRLLEDDKPVSDRAVYDIGYAVKGGGLFDSAKVILRGVSLVSRGTGGQAKIDALWAQRMKKAAK